MNKNCIISLIIFLNNIIKIIPEGDYLNIKNTTNTNISEIIFYYLKKTKNKNYNFNNKIDQDIFKLINKISIKRNIYNEFITLFIIILQNLGKINKKYINNYFSIEESIKFYKPKFLNEINSINDLNLNLYKRYFNIKSEKHDYLYLNFNGDDIQSLINNKERYEIEKNVYKHNVYNFNDIIIIYLPRFSYNNEIQFNKKNIKINYNLLLKSNDFRLLSLIYYNNSSNCKFCCMENQNDNIIINDNRLYTIKKNENSKFLSFNGVEKTCLYLIYKKIRKKTMYSFDFDGVVHRSVKEVDKDGFRSPNDEEKETFNNVIVTFKKLLEIENNYINIITHNKNVRNDIKKIFDKENIKMSKVNLNIVKWGQEKSKIIKENNFNVFIDDSPKIINECINGNIYNFFNNPLTIYYSIPELNKFVKIDEKNVNLVKISPKIPIKVIEDINDKIKINLSLKIISYNVCYQAILHKAEGSAKDLGEICSKIGEETQRYVCKDNILNIITNIDYDFIGISEGNVGFINELIDILEDKYNFSYDFIIGNTEIETAKEFIVFKKSRFVSMKLKKEGCINNDQKRPFVSDLFVDKYSNETFNVMSLHAPHEEYDTESEILKGINRNLENLIVMGDFNKDITNDLIINDKKLNTINKDKKTCCLRDKEKSFSENYQFAGDNILIDDSFDIEYVEYLDSTINNLIPKDSDKLITSDHYPISAKIQKTLIIEKENLIKDKDILGILFDDTTNLSNISIVDEISI